MVATAEPKELVIVGGGPAGLAAALEAGSLGVEVSLLDERPALGGQIYKQFASGFSVLAPRRLGHDYLKGNYLIRAVEASGADIRTNSVVWGIWDKKVAYVTDDCESGVIDARCIILAPGAFDRPVAFPGWTLPGVMMAGGAKALAQSQRVLPGRRILVAGSGPLILALSAELQGLGARLAGVIEAAPRPSVTNALRLLARAHGNEPLLVDAVRYWTRLLGHRVPLRYSSIVVRAEGEGEVRRAVVARVDQDWRAITGTETVFEVDTICLGYGFQASSELSRLCGCRQRYDEAGGGYIPVRDAWMRTSVPGILAVGDGSGIGGSRIAIEEGRLAGLRAALELGRITPVLAQDRERQIRNRLRRMNHFRRVLGDIYRVGPGIFDLASADTIVCRCEDVTRGELEKVLDEQTIEDPNIAKGFTRIGMGLCQGRYCARQVSAIVAQHTGLPIDKVQAPTVRPPVKPISIGAIAEERPELSLPEHIVQPLGVSPGPPAIRPNLGPFDTYPDT